MACNRCDRFIKSSSITTTSTNLVITLSTTPTLTNLKRFCLVLAQSLPSGANTLPVQIQIGTTVYPVYTRTGNLLRADQIRYGIKCIGFNRWDLYFVMNMLYSDYYNVLGSDTATYVKMSKAWFEDPDVSEGKAYRYYMQVAKA